MHEDVDIVLGLKTMNGAKLINVLRHFTRRRKIPTKKIEVKQVITCKLNRKTASENRFFSFVLPLGSKKRKDEAVEIEIFGLLATDIVENCVTLSFR